MSTSDRDRVPDRYGKVEYGSENACRHGTGGDR